MSCALGHFLVVFLDGLAGKESACNAGDTEDEGFIPGLGRSPGGGNDNPLQYSCLKNPMDRGAWWATVHGVARAGHDKCYKHMCSSSTTLLKLR